MRDLVSWALGVLAYAGVIATLVAALQGLTLATLIWGAITIVCGFGMFVTSAA